MHVQIVDALDQGELARAEALMSAHIGSVQAALRLHASTDPLAQLRQALAPVSDAAVIAHAAQDLHTRTPKARRRKLTEPAADSSTYLGALL